MALKLSVIIPTRDRVDILLRGLELLADQDTSDYEVIIVDDSERRTALEVLGGREFPYPLKTLSSGGRGPAFARNRGIEAAAGELILFLGDDTWVRDKSFLGGHIRLAEESAGAAVLGKVGWDREVQVTAFMDFLAPNGPQFRYGDISDSRDAGYTHFFTSNISLPRKWLELEMFDEEFSDAALEDIELGYRLEKRGLRIVYDSSLSCGHHHLYELRAFCARMEVVGKSSKILLRKHPELRRQFMPFPEWVMRFGCFFMRSTGLFRIAPRRVRWWIDITQAYLAGRK